MRPENGTAQTTMPSRNLLSIRFLDLQEIGACPAQIRAQRSRIDIVDIAVR